MGINTSRRQETLGFPELENVRINRGRLRLWAGMASAGASPRLQGQGPQ